ncbi:MAG TPA: peptide MFS transporter [Caulobacteraceae bacterium]|nr:peptide MFS transporter [Caulobacteraceae bacterium]
MSEPGETLPALNRLEWLGQPRGLSVLFLTEMWTQFSFFGMRTILVYYMTKSLRIDQQDSSLIYGGYAAAVYFTPIFGGLIADRFIGKRNAVVAGGLLMAAGHFMMVFPSLFYPALGAIALGNGLFLPSLSSQINSLYAEGDPRLASAYNVYYVGINLGAFLAPFVCGTLGEVYGWHWGFAAAGIGMLIGLITYLAGLRYLPAEPPRGRLAPARSAEIEPPRRRFLLLLGIMAVVVVFRGAYEQNGNTIALWTDSGVDRHLTGGLSIPMTWFQALNPLLIFVLTPILVSYWTRQAKKGRETSSVRKMVTGAVLVGLSFVLISVVSAHSAAAHTRSSWIWLALFFVVLTAGELFILPVGLGLFGRLAPKGFEATAIAIWFFAGFAGNLFAGGLGVLWSRLSQAQFFMLIALVSGVAALLLTAFVPAGARAERSLRAEG